MRNRIRRRYFARYALLAAGVVATSSATGLRFEVASVRLAPDLATVMAAAGPGKMPHLGTKIDGDRVDMGSISLTGLFMTAYTVPQADRVSGPAWMAMQRFDVLAKLPPGATKEQLPEMVQALLEERFHLKFHRTTHVVSALALQIGPKGHKLEPGIPDPKAEDDDKSKSSGSGAFGGQIGNGLYGPQRILMSNGVIHNEFFNISTKSLAEFLSGRLGRLVVDMTGLQDKYHVVLDQPVSETREAMADDQSASAYAAISNSGLKLESQKVSVEQFVIDQIDKLPTEN